LCSVRQFTVYVLFIYKQTPSNGTASKWSLGKPKLLFHKGFILHTLHIRALYHTKSNNPQLMHKMYIIFTIKTSYMVRPRWVIFRENSFFTLGLHLYSWVRMSHWLRTPLRGNVESPRSGYERGLSTVTVWTLTSLSTEPDRGESTFPLNGVRSQWHILTQLYKCNPSVTKLFSLKMTQRGRNMWEVFIVKIIYFLCNSLWLLFFEFYSCLSTTLLVIAFTHVIVKGC
jgi:hypothetical protein